jgi:hypothetical protein
VALLAVAAAEGIGSYNEYLDTFLQVKAIDDQQFYRVAIGALRTALVILEVLGEYFIPFSLLWVLLCWPPPKRAGLAHAVECLIKTGVVAVLAICTYGAVESLVRSFGAWKGYGLGFAPSLTVTVLYLGAGRLLRRRTAGSSELPLLPPATIAAYLCVVAMIEARGADAHVLVAWIAVLFCVSAVVFHVPNGAPRRREP